MTCRKHLGALSVCALLAGAGGAVSAQGIDSVFLDDRALCAFITSKPYDEWSTLLDRAGEALATTTGNLDDAGWPAISARIPKGDDALHFCEMAAWSVITEQAGDTFDTGFSRADRERIYRPDFIDADGRLDFSAKELAVVLRMLMTGRKCGAFEYEAIAERAHDLPYDPVPGLNRMAAVKAYCKQHL